jgi:ADP-heptose:LPS heptosyltransferase
LTENEREGTMKRTNLVVYLDLLDDDGISLADFAASAKRRTNHYVLLIPAGTSKYKLYPADQYVELARILRQQHEVHFLPGKGMKEVLDGLASVQDACVVHRDKSTGEMRDIVLGARLVIANDCGPFHFAHIYDVAEDRVVC